MWLAGGLAVVAAAVVLVTVAFLEDERRTVVPGRRGAVTAAELRSAELPVAWRGYARGHVDALLARAAQALEDAERYGVEPSAGPITREGVAPTPGPSGVPSFLAAAVAWPDEPESPPGSSGEELEDGGGDDPGRLDG